MMAELGNVIVNKIYEAQVYEIIAKRANADSDSETRENWIKAKYVAKAFITGDLLAGPHGRDVSEGSKSWTVRRLRRRARTASLRRGLKKVNTVNFG